MKTLRLSEQVDLAFTKRLRKAIKRFPESTPEKLRDIMLCRLGIRKEDYSFYLEALDNHVIPENATIRNEYVIGKDGEERGSYIYAYWKDNTKKLHKKYIGKSFESNHFRRVFLKPYEMTAGQYQKYKFLRKHAEDGNNELAKEYWERFNHRGKSVSLDWAYRVVSKNLPRDSYINTGFR